MAAATFAQTSFLGGLWSKWAQGRFDRPDYRSAMNECFNCIPIEQGSCPRRPGTQFVGTTRAGVIGRLIPFDFKQASPYLVEFTAGFLRFWNGANLVTSNDDQVVGGISSANPAEVTTLANHGWLTGNSVKFANFSGATPLLQNRVFVITKTGNTKFTLVDAITGATINGSTLGGTSSTLTVQRIHEINTGYIGTLWQDVRLVQAELTAVLLHPTVPTQVLTAVPPPTGQTFFNFTLAPVSFIDGPFLDPPLGNSVVTPSATSGIITVTLSFLAWSSGKAYQKGDFASFLNVNYQSLIDQNQNLQPNGNPTAWTAVSAGISIGPNGFVGTDIGRLMRIFNSGWATGKIVAILNQFNPSVPAIGNMVSNGGLVAAFDSVTGKAIATSAVLIGASDPTNAFVGKNFTSSPQKIGSVTIWIPSDGFISATKTYTQAITSYQAQLVSGSPQWVQQGGVVNNQQTVAAPVAELVFNLRGKQTVPLSSSDGTLLGQFITSQNVGGGTNVSLTSNDQSTSWNYLWVEFQAFSIDTTTPQPSDGRSPNPPTVGQVSVSATAYSLAYSPVFAIAVTIPVAQVQFFSPPGTGSGNSVSLELINSTIPVAGQTQLFQLGAYSNTTGWPSCGTYHEGRLWLAGAIDNRVDASMSNSPFIFSPTSPTGVVSDNNAIAAVFNAPDVNAIFWLVPDALGIIVGTQAGDWLIQASALNNPLTPTNMQAHRFSKMGCANIEPRRADHTLILVQRFRRKLFEYFADVYSGKFGAQNVTWAMRQLAKPGIAEIAYQQELAPIIWARCDDGSWFGITYKRESNVSSQPPNFAAGHRHSLGSGRTVESIAVGPSADGTLDSLAMVTNDPTSGIRHVEIMTPIMEEAVAESSAWFLDDAVMPTSTSTSDVTPSPYGGLTINGLWHLNNRGVTVFAGGLDCGDFAVTNGSITVPYGDGISAGTASGMFTAAFAAGATIVVGFNYKTQGQIVRPMTQQESGAHTGPALGKKRRTAKYGVLLDNCGPILFGTSFSKLMPANFRTANGTPFATGQMFSGVYRGELKDDYSYDSMICWEINRPYSGTVVAIEQFVQTSDE